MNHLHHIEALEREVTRFVAAVRDVDLSCPVPSCPDWDLAALVGHLGTVHRWAAWHVEHLAETRVAATDIGIDPPEAPDLASWLARGGAELCSTLRAADPGAPMWAWGADQHVRFWSRRQLHETAVHRADAELALGHHPVVDPAIAIDGIDELLANLPCAAYFAPKTAQLRGAGESLHLHCTDSDGEWMITFEPDGFRTERAHGKGSAAVRGAASDLLLLMYRRVGRADLRFELFGDTDLVDFWLEHSAL